jgi:uncharacterized protein YukE
MPADKDTYLIAPEEVLETATTLAKIAHEGVGWLSDLNTVANDNLDKNLTTDARNQFNQLWSKWYQRLQDLVQTFAALAIVMEKGVVATLQQDKDAAEAFVDDPNVTKEIGQDIEDIKKEIEAYTKGITPEIKSPASPNPTNNTTEQKQPEQKQ